MVSASESTSQRRLVFDVSALDLADDEAIRRWAEDAWRTINTEWSPK